MTNVDRSPADQMSAATGTQGGRSSTPDPQPTQSKPQKTPKPLIPRWVLDRLDEDRRRRPTAGVRLIGRPSKW